MPAMRPSDRGSRAQGRHCERASAAVLLLALVQLPQPTLPYKLIMPEEHKVHRNSKAMVEEPSPYRDTVLEVLDEMNRPPRRTFGDFSRAYREQCAKDGTEPECPF